MKKHLIIIFLLLISRLAFCQSPCLTTSDFTFTASPPPTNGSYAPGTTVTFCLNITNFAQTNSNWLHGITPTLGPGWNVSTLTATTTPPAAGGGGTWGWYPGGETGGNSGTLYGAGFYFESASGTTASCGCADNNPGNNFGDDATCCWTFCFSATTNSSCTSGTSLDVTVTTTGDYLSGSWSSTGCQNDAVPTLNATCSGCPPPTMSSTPATCASPNGGTATATASGTSSPWVYNWSSGTVQTLSTASTITGLGAGTYTVTVTDNTSCTSSATVNVINTSNVSAGPPQLLTCVPGLQGATATMSATGAGGLWSAQAANPGTAVITTPSSPTTTITSFSSTGTYHFIWTAGACTDTTTVTVTEAPTLSPTVADITCTNATGVIYANAANGAPPYTYIWSNGGNADSITTTTSGVLYTVTVTDNNLCTAIATDSVADQIIIVGLTDSIQEVSCYGYNDGQIALGVTPPGNYTYIWSNGDNTSVIANLSPGNTYAVTVSDPQGCSTTGGPYTITSPTQDSLSVTPLDTIMALGDTIHLGSTLTGAYPAISYSWTPAYGLSCDTCPDPLFIPVDLDTVRTLYTLVATYYNGCIVSASDTLLARTTDLVAIPDAFTPNGDGINDVFFIPAWSVKEFHLAIYDRWGTQVFETDDVNTGWDGTYKGKPEPEEVYTFFFTILHFDGKTESHQGTVTLFR